MKIKVYGIGKLKCSFLSSDFRGYDKEYNTCFRVHYKLKYQKCIYAKRQN